VPNWTCERQGGVEEEAVVEVVDIGWAADVAGATMSVSVFIAVSVETPGKLG
jgi:hypothetical protein